MTNIQTGRFHCWAVHDCACLWQLNQCNVGDSEVLQPGRKGSKVQDDVLQVLQESSTGTHTDQEEEGIVGFNTKWHGITKQKASK